MSSELALRPLVKWDGFALQVDLDMVELVANRELARRTDAIRRVGVTGEGEVLKIHLDVALKGLPASVSASLSELRLLRRFFGCRIEALHGPLGIPLPVALAGALARRLAPDLLRFDSEDRILLVDLRRFLPEGLEVRISDVWCEGRWLMVEVAGGSVAAVLAAMREV
ncbi:MAG TPA: hypothetical protein VMT45_10405 [Thermoanaerobaculaceae bacterium]|nr:hypothetical protein [Thermoanaerobaculaceae bacterium]